MRYFSFYLALSPALVCSLTLCRPYPSACHTLKSLSIKIFSILHKSYPGNGKEWKWLNAVHCTCVSLPWAPKIHRSTFDDEKQNTESVKLNQNLRIVFSQMHIHTRSFAHKHRCESHTHTTSCLHTLVVQTLWIRSINKKRTSRQRTKA